MTDEKRSSTPEPSPSAKPAAPAASAAPHSSAPPFVPIVPAQTQRVKPAVVKKPARKTKKRRFVLTRFDKDLLSALSRGGGLGVLQFIAAYNLDAARVQARVAELEKHRLLARDALDANLVRLTPDGYEAVVPRTKREKNAAVLPALSPTASPPPSTPAPPAPPTPLATLPATQAPTFATSAASKADAVDYVELLQAQRQLTSKSRPRVAVARHAEQKKEETGGAAAVLPTTPSRIESARGAEDKCELCKGPFKLSVADSTLGLYGHHFCGAAYHQECYDALLETGGGACVRCGKKLVLALDEKSEDAVKEIKKLFD